MMKDAFKASKKRAVEKTTLQPHRFSSVTRICYSLAYLSSQQVEVGLE